MGQHKRELKKRTLVIKIKNMYIIIMYPHSVSLLAVNLMVLNMVLGLWIFGWIIGSAIIYFIDDCD
jgi:hypothetical protein